MQIQFTLTNGQGSNYTVKVFDWFGNTPREIAGSPFAIASGATEGPMSANADNNGDATIEYQAQGGPSLRTTVSNGDNVTF